ncbi:MAG: nucleoside-diphosphate kinase [Rickettsiales bacterium]|nr:nucleoside-diphosphate kinase [Rickettsiales bacterium]
MFRVIALISLLTSLISVNVLAADITVKTDDIAGPTIIKVEKNKWVLQRTFGVIKPSGMSKISEIKSIIAAYGLEMRYSKKIILTEKQVEKLYEMHKDKPFFEDLKSSLVGKEVIVFILYGKNAVKRYRDAVKEIRSKYALNKTENAVHGSDSWERGKEEINMFFKCNNKTCK